MFGGRRATLRGKWNGPAAVAARRPRFRYIGDAAEEDLVRRRTVSCLASLRRLGPNAKSLTCGEENTPKRSLPMFPRVLLTLDFVGPIRLASSSYMTKRCSFI